MKPFIDPAFWSDPEIEKMPAGGKLCVLWLVTNSQTSLLGICGASTSRFTFETGLPEKALTRALEGLPRSIIRVGDQIFIRNYIRHQFGSGEKLMRNNFFVTLKSLFLGVKDEKLQAAILAEYPEFNEALTRATKGLNKPKAGTDRKGKDGRVEDGQALRIAAVFKRKPTTAWDSDEVKAWETLRKNGPLDELEIALVERYYESERNKPDNICRTALVRLLRHWPGEVDRARAWCDKHPVKKVKPMPTKKEVERPPEDPAQQKKFLLDFKRIYGRLPYGFTEADL